MFGNLGMGEMIFIGIIILLVFGARRLPEIGQSLGKGIREFKKSMSDITGELNNTVQPPPQQTQYPQPYQQPQYAPPTQPYVPPAQAVAAVPPPAVEQPYQAAPVQAQPVQAPRTPAGPQGPTQG